MQIGILAFQGAFWEHQRMLENLGAEVTWIRKDIPVTLNGLVLPGGESSVIGRHMDEGGLTERIRTLAIEGFPILATCAGSILMAKNVIGERLYGGIGAVPLTVERNAYGPQIESKEAPVILMGKKAFPGVFIRAPRFNSWEKEVIPFAICGKECVGVKWRGVLLTSFHPELTEDSSIHKIFLRLCKMTQPSSFHIGS